MLFLKNLIFSLIIPATVSVYVPLYISRNYSAVSGFQFVFALALLAIGGIIYVWCVWDFAVFGRATPLPIDAPKRLVIRGMYRWTRNPIYLGELIILIGWTMMFGGLQLLVYTVCVGIAFHLFVIFYEEPHLEKLFGDEYRAYCAKVYRWLPMLP